MFVAAAAGLLLERLRKFIKDTRMLDDVAEVLTEANSRHRYLRTRISLGKGAYADVFLGMRPCLKSHRLIHLQAST
jgi:hypothetical protein